jgi:ATP-dependent Lhr-like helicase
LNAVLGIPIVPIELNRRTSPLPCWVRLRNDVTFDLWKAAVCDAAERICLPEVDEQAVQGLEFNAALAPRLAAATLASRFG